MGYEIGALMWVGGQVGQPVPRVAVGGARPIWDLARGVGRGVRQGKSDKGGRHESVDTQCQYTEVLDMGSAHRAVCVCGGGKGVLTAARCEGMCVWEDNSSWETVKGGEGAFSPPRGARGVFVARRRRGASRTVAACFARAPLPPPGAGSPPTSQRKGCEDRVYSVFFTWGRGGGGACGVSGGVSGRVGAGDWRR